MKRLMLAGLIAISWMISGRAQYHEGYYLIYGHRDASPITVRLGQEVAIPAWGATNPEVQAESVAYMHNPLAADTMIVKSRLGGSFPDTFVGRWDQRNFLDPSPDLLDSGFTNQSMIGFAYLYDPPDPENLFFTNGDTVIICYYRMTLTSDPAYADTTVYPFREGNDPRNHSTIWGMQDGLPQAVPIITFSPLHFVTCRTSPGDANSDGIFNGLDIVYEVNYLKGIGPTPPCIRDCPPFYGLYATADINGNCRFDGIDITYGINYLKGPAPEPRFCADCVPVGASP